MPCAVRRASTSHSRSPIEMWYRPSARRTTSTMCSCPPTVTTYFMLSTVSSRPACAGAAAPGIAGAAVRRRGGDGGTTATLVLREDGGDDGHGLQAGVVGVDRGQHAVEEAGGQPAGDEIRMGHDALE